jgi:hypothetical protein
MLRQVHIKTVVELPGGASAVSDWISEHCLTDVARIRCACGHQGLQMQISGCFKRSMAIRWALQLP